MKTHEVLIKGTCALGISFVATGCLIALEDTATLNQYHHYDTTTESFVAETEYHLPDYEHALAGIGLLALGAAALSVCNKLVILDETMTKRSLEAHQHSS